MTKHEFIEWFDAQVQPRWPTWPVNACIIGDWYQVFGRFDPEPLTEAVRRHKIRDDPARPKINAIRSILCARTQGHGPGPSDPSPAFFIECTTPPASHLNRVSTPIGVHIQPTPHTHEALAACAESIRQRHEHLYGGHWMTVMACRSSCSFAAEQA